MIVGQNEGPVLSGEFRYLCAGGVKEPHRVISEIRHLDCPSPRVSLQAPHDVPAVLLMLVAASVINRVRHRCHQFSRTLPELLCQCCTGVLTRPARCDVLGVVFGRVVQQGSAGHVRVIDAVVTEDADGNPEQVVGIRFALPPVPQMQLRCQRQGVPTPGVICGGEPRDLDQQALAQASFAMHGRDRMQRHPGQQAQLRRAKPANLS